MKLEHYMDIANEQQEVVSKLVSMQWDAAIDINSYAPNGYAQNAPSGWDPSGSRGGNFGSDLYLNIGEIAKTWIRLGR